MRTLLTGLALALLACGCGASSPRPATHGDFARIQVAEAELDRASHAALEGAGGCPDRCAARARADAAAREVCAVAHETTDADAAERCEAARRRAEEVGAAVRRACPCEAPDAEETR